MKLFSKWRVISNSKTAFSANYYIENAVVNGDQKQSFPRAMSEWVQAWQTERIPSCKKLTLTAQTGSGVVRTLLCLASFIEDLLGEGYDFVLTSRFQKDPRERRYGQSRKVSGGRFLVRLRDVPSSG